MSTAATHNWQQKAACAGLDPEMFFPEQSGHIEARRAKQVCADCPVRAECLAYAVRHGIEHGIWGGLSQKERRGMGAPRTPAGHGTRTCYLYGCRCDDCRQANKNYQRKWRQATRVEPVERHNLHGQGGRFVKRAPDDAA